MESILALESGQSSLRPQCGLCSDEGHDFPKRIAHRNAKFLLENGKGPHSSTETTTASSGRLVRDRMEWGWWRGSRRGRREHCGVRERFAGSRSLSSSVYCLGRGGTPSAESFRPNDSRIPFLQLAADKCAGLPPLLGLEEGGHPSNEHRLDD